VSVTVLGMEQRRPDAAVAELASQQRGLIRREQALSSGMTARMIQRRLSDGLWRPVHHGVYALTGAPNDRAQDLRAALLHAGPESALSMHTAGRCHGCEEALELPQIFLNVSDARGRSPLGVVWHRQIDMIAGDVTEIDGLPVTTIERTAMDLAAIISITRLRRLIESMIVHRGYEPWQFGEVLARVRRSGKPGVSAMERVLDDVGPGTSLPHSELERLLDRVIGLAGLPAPIHEHPLPGARDRPGFVDRCWPEVRLIVEGDGRRWHTRRQQISIDYDRRTDSQTVGYQTTALLWERLRGDAEGCAERLGKIYEQRAAETAPR